VNSLDVLGHVMRTRCQIGTTTAVIGGLLTVSKSVTISVCEMVVEVCIHNVQQGV